MPRRTVTKKMRKVFGYSAEDANIFDLDKIYVELGKRKKNHKERK